MSYKRWVYLSCSHKDCVLLSDNFAFTVAEARAAARQDGWRVRYGADVCGQHAKASRDELSQVRSWRPSVVLNCDWRRPGTGPAPVYNFSGYDNAISVSVMELVDRMRAAGLHLHDADCFEDGVPLCPELRENYNNCLQWHDAQAMTVAEARAAARQDGWSFVDGRDICDFHTDNPAGEELPWDIEDMSS